MGCAESGHTPREDSVSIPSACASRAECGRLSLALDRQRQQGPRGLLASGLAETSKLHCTHPPCVHTRRLAFHTNTRTKVLLPRRMVCFLWPLSWRSLLSIHVNGFSSHSESTTARVPPCARIPLVHRCWACIPRVHPWVHIPAQPMALLLGRL